MLVRGGDSQPALLHFGPNGQQDQPTVPKDYQGFPKTWTASKTTATSLDTATLLPLSLSPSPFISVSRSTTIVPKPVPKRS